MYDSRIEFAINNFIEEGYLLPMNTSYDLEELSKEGKSILSVTVNNENICVENYDTKKRCNFLRVPKNYGMQKCIDHFLLCKKEEAWDIHMIEMKTSVGNSTWLDVKHKMRSSYLNIKALCVFLGIKVGDVYAYTTFNKVAFEGMRDTANVKIHIPQLGKKAENFKDDEWNKGIIKVLIDDVVVFPHKGIQMARNTNGVLSANLRI